MLCFERASWWSRIDVMAHVAIVMPTNGSSWIATGDLLGEKARQCCYGVAWASGSEIRSQMALAVTRTVYPAWAPARMKFTAETWAETV